MHCIVAYVLAAATQVIVKPVTHMWAVGRTTARHCLTLGFTHAHRVPNTTDQKCSYQRLPWVRVQVVKLGSPVTGVQLSPSQDLLATCHVKRRGIYLWYNHLMFGSGADIQPSTRPVNAALPSIATGESSC